MKSATSFASRYAVLCAFRELLNAFQRQGRLMVSALESGASGPGSSPGRGHSVVFLVKKL